MGDSYFNDQSKNTVDAQGVVKGVLAYNPLDISATTSVDDAVAQLVNAANDGLSAKVTEKLVSQVTIRPGGLVEVTLVSFGKGDDSELLEEPRSIVPIYEVAKPSTDRNGDEALTVTDHTCLANVEYFGLKGSAGTLGQVLGLEHPEGYTVRVQILAYAPKGDTTEDDPGTAIKELLRRFSTKVTSYVGATQVEATQGGDTDIDRVLAGADADPTVAVARSTVVAARPTGQHPPKNGKRGRRVKFA
jgi:hypothetical protein